MKNLQYSELKLQEHYKSKYIHSGNAKNLFKWRTRMIDLKCNFKAKYANLDCELCFQHSDNAEGLLICEKIRELVEDIQEYKYKDLFGDDIAKMANVAKLLDKAFSKRNELNSHYNSA